MTVEFVYCKGCSEKDKMDVFHPFPSSCSGVEQKDHEETYAKGLIPCPKCGKTIWCMCAVQKSLNETLKNQYSTKE